MDVVYIVMYGEYSDHGIEGVYSTFGKACDRILSGDVLGKGFVIHEIRPGSENRPDDGLHWTITYSWESTNTDTENPYQHQDVYFIRKFLVDENVRQEEQTHPELWR
jgi:hypothetical protein